MTDTQQVEAVVLERLTVACTRDDWLPATQPMLSVMARLSCGWCGMRMGALPLDDPEVKPVWRGRTPIHSLCVEAWELDQHHQQVQARGAKRYRRGERVQ